MDSVVYPTVASALQLSLLVTLPTPRDPKKASEMKQRGNEHFKHRKYRFAADCYTSVSEFVASFGVELESVREFPGPIFQALELSPLTEDHNYSKAVYYSNRAACYLHMVTLTRALLFLVVANFQIIG